MADVNPQVGGVLATTAPAVIAVLVAIGVMDKTVAEAITDPVVQIAGGVGTLATALAAMYMFWKSSQPQIVKSASEVAPKGVKVVVGPQAPEAIKALAADPAVPNVVPGQV